MIKQLKRFKNRFIFSFQKGYYEVLEKKGLLKTTLFSTEVNESGYITRKDIALVRKSSSVYAVIHNVVFKDMFGKELHVPYIATDDLFEKLSQDTKVFVLEHEMYHFVNHKDILLRKCERLIDLEKEADLGAAKVVGYEKALMALMELQKVADGIIDKDEVEERIAYITTLLYNRKVKIL